MRKRLLWVVVGSCVVLALIVGGIFVARKAQSAATIAALCTSIQTQITERGAVIDVPGQGERVGVLGDSWATGDTLSDYRNAWPFVAAEISGGHLIVAGQGGTGFANAGYCDDGVFAVRAVALASEMPDRVIVAGGLNDVGRDAEAITAGVQATLAALGVPSIVVGPVDVPGREGELEVDAVLRDECQKLGVPYYSALDWPVEIGADGVHPTDLGSRQYADLILSLPS